MTTSNRGIHIHSYLTFNPSTNMWLHAYVHPPHPRSVHHGMLCGGLGFGFGFNLQACDTFKTSILGYFTNAGAVDDAVLAPAQHECPGCHGNDCDTVEDDDGDYYGYNDGSDGGGVEDSGVRIKAVVDSMSDAGKCVQSVRTLSPTT